MAKQMGGCARLLTILVNSKHREHAEVREWLGDDFDFAAFDAVVVDAFLLKLKV